MDIYNLYKYGLIILADDYFGNFSFSQEVALLWDQGYWLEEARVRGGE